MFDIVETEKNLLIIDQDETKRKILTSFFSSKYNCDEADSLNAAVDKIREKEYSVILTTFTLSSLNAIDLMPYLQELSPRTIPVFISDSEAAGNTVRAFRAGAFEVIQKPFELKKAEAVIEKAFGKFDIRCLKDRYQYHLEELVAERTVELDKALEEIENSYRMTLKALVQALETRDFETHGHSERVVTFSLRLGYELGLEKEALRDLELGALLHDIGKIGVPDAVLRKPAKLNEDEWAKMRLHPQHGQKILRNIPFLEGAARIVAQHHERWDGEGYPFGLRGEDIEIGARIFAVVDAFDAMVSDRVYRKGCSYQDALAELERCAGTQFDPVVVEAFKAIPKEDWEILRERSLMEKQEISSLSAVVSELVYSRQQFEMVH
ncbi:MAG TPA: HD domain-containing phosphohydrolase [Pyrinomonadaceae bacterium]|jgi:response regulator RpfG family c-di-GMP phosphodiesterase